MKCPYCSAQIAYFMEEHGCTAPELSSGDPPGPDSFPGTDEGSHLMATKQGVKGLNYGVSPEQNERIRERLGIDPAEAKLLLEQFLDRYPEMARWFRRHSTDELLGHVLSMDPSGEHIVFDDEAALPGAPKFLQTKEEFAKHVGKWEPDPKDTEAKVRNWMEQRTENLNRSLSNYGVHPLKTWPSYFLAVYEGRKTFEVRKNDRDFHVGDTLVLREWDPEKEDYTGRRLEVYVTYMTDVADMGVLKEGYVILGIRKSHDY